MTWKMPVLRFAIVAITPGHFLETTTLSAKAAAKRDPDRFLEFAAKMNAPYDAELSSRPLQGLSPIIQPK